MDFTLGLNFFAGHDTSVFAIFKDDIFALSQERVTRIKHDSIFPIDAIYEMIRYKNIDTKKVKNIKVGVATLSFKDRHLDEYAYEMTTALRDMLKSGEELYIKEFIQQKEQLKNSKWTMLKNFLLNPHGRRYLKLKLLSKKKPLKELVQKHLKNIFPFAKLDITYYEHHLCHAYTTYYTSGFEDALVFTFDGEGDGVFQRVFEVKDKKFNLLGSSQNIFIDSASSYDFADKGYISVGNIYSIFTHLLGFTPHADEGKVEALAAFGDSKNFLYEKLKNTYKIENLSITLQKKPLEELFSKEFLKNVFEKLSKEDISASIQRYSEDVVLDYLKQLKKTFPQKNLAVAGGVMANVIINNKIYQNLFDSIHITPAMGDDGIAMGASIMKYLETNSTFNIPTMPYFGSSFSTSQIEEVLKKSGLRYEFLGEQAYIKAAQSIVSKKIGALFQGRAEFGPRALGNRSIIASVQDKDIQKKINSSIKNRPLFQPFCPSIMIEEKSKLFEKAYDNKHMTIAFKLKQEFKDAIPGSVHVDLTARVQFVSKEDNKNYYELIKEVKNLTGYGVIINTSFNKHGRTMVLNPKQAIIDFLDTNLDFLVMEGFWITR